MSTSKIDFRLLTEIIAPRLSVLHESPAVDICKNFC